MSSRSVDFLRYTKHRSPTAKLLTPDILRTGDYFVTHIITLFTLIPVPEVDVNNQLQKLQNIAPILG